MHDIVINAVIPALSGVLLLLFVLRRPIKSAYGRWTDHVQANEADLSELIAREKERMRDEEDQASLQ